MANERIKTAARESQVRLWELAESFGMTDSAFSRKLRHEFSDAERESALEAIQKIQNERR